MVSHSYNIHPQYIGFPESIFINPVSCIRKDRKTRKKRKRTENKTKYVLSYTICMISSQRGQQTLGCRFKFQITLVSEEKTLWISQGISHTSAFEMHNCDKVPTEQTVIV